MHSSPPSPSRLLDYQHDEHEWNNLRRRQDNACVQQMENMSKEALESGRICRPHLEYNLLAAPSALYVYL